MFENQFGLISRLALSVRQLQLDTGSPLYYATKLHNNFLLRGDSMERLIPKFRFGHIDPAAVEARRARRGPGYEFYQIVPTNIMLVTAVLGIKDFTREAVETAIPNYWNCVDALAEEKVDVFVLGGTPVSAHLGRSRVVRLLKEAEDKTGIRGDAPLEAPIAAMQHLGLKKIAVGGRWTDEFNRAVIRYLEEGGINVVGITKRGQWGKEALPCPLRRA